jgi:predicted nucleic acid-binding protein
MARIVIADAGPLIALASIDVLPVLRGLFSQIYVTGSVRDECLAKAGADAQRIGAAIIEGWLHVQPVKNSGQPLSPSLGIGESDSIRFALEAPESALLIVDDRLARRYALQKGLSIVGTVRLLDLAERRGYIESAEQCINEMTDFGYRISVNLLRKIRSK